MRQFESLTLKMNVKVVEDLNENLQLKVLCQLAYVCKMVFPAVSSQFTLAMTLRFLKTIIERIQLCTVHIIVISHGNIYFRYEHC